MKTRNNRVAAGTNLSGRYANYFKIGHNAFEFLVEFGQLYEEEEETAAIHTRIVMSPSSAKELLKTLDCSMRAFEKMTAATEFT